MLSAVIQRGKLKRSEREAFEDIWDRIHRYGRATPKQKAWIERVYFDQKLDRFKSKPPSESMPRSGYITHSGVSKMVIVTSEQQLRDVCPFIPAGSKTFDKVKLFFDRGGEVLKIKPKSRSQLPSAPPV